MRLSSASMVVILAAACGGAVPLCDASRTSTRRGVTTWLGDVGEIDAGSADSGADGGPDFGVTDAGEVRVAAGEIGQSFLMGAPGDAGPALSLIDASMDGLAMHRGDASIVALSSAINEYNNSSAPYTEHSGVSMMAQMRRMGAILYDSLLLSRAQQGAPYSQIKKNGNGLEQSADAGVNDGGAGYPYDGVFRGFTDVCTVIAPRKLRLGFFHLNHGQGDQRFGHSQEYGAFMLALKSDLNTDMRALPCVLDQDIPLLMTQVSSASAYEREHELVAWEQFRIARTDAGVYLAGPTYQHTAFPLQHLINTEYREMGAEDGTHGADLLDDGNKRSDLYFTAAASSDKIILTYVGCTTPMVLDSTTVSTTNLDNHGFKLYTAGGRTISSVAVGSSACTIELTLSGTVYAGTRVSYAGECPNSAEDAGVLSDIGSRGTCNGGGAGPTSGMRGTARDSACYGAWYGALDGGADAGPPDVDSGYECLHNWADIQPPTAVSGGADYAPYENTGAWRFDGTGDFLITADTANLNATNHLTACATVSVEAYGSGLGIMSKSANGACGWGVSISSAGLLGFTTCATSGGDGSIRDFSTNAVGLNARKHVCVVYDGSQGTETNRVVTYIQGSADAIGTTAGTTPTSLIASSASVRVGRFQDGNDGSTDLTGWRSFQGTIDNVMIWTGEALSAAEVSSLYCSGASTCDPRASMHSSGDWPETDPVVWLGMADRNYVTSAGVFLGTQDGYSGFCKGTYPSTSENGVCSSLVVGDPVPIEVLTMDTGAIYNLGTESSSRFTRNGNPMPVRGL